MRAGRPSAKSLAVISCSEVVTALINGEQPASTVPERRIAARLLADYGVDRRAIAFLLGVDVRTVSRYTRSEPA